MSTKFPEAWQLAELVHDKLRHKQCMTAKQIVRLDMEIESLWLKWQQPLKGVQHQLDAKAALHLKCVSLRRSEYITVSMSPSSKACMTMQILPSFGRTSIDRV